MPAQRGQAEQGTLTLPVDYRRCRSHRCSDAPDRPGDVWASSGGRQATVFTRVVDLRPKGGSLYLQYWLYYPDSTYNGTARALARRAPNPPLLTPAGAQAREAARAVAGFHPDDWESYQVRVRPDGRADARASAHHGYTGRRVGPDLNLNQLPDDVPKDRLVAEPDRRAWIPVTGWSRVSRGSHAGHIVDGPSGERHTVSNGLAIVPIESLSEADLGTEFPKIAPPWRKQVYRHPESPDT